MRYSFFLIIFLISSGLQAQIKHVFQDNQTFTYDEVTAAYKGLAKSSEMASLFQMGNGDCGLPIYLFVIDKSQEFSSEAAHEQEKAVVFINNAIHPGEPCGVDASVKFAEQLLTKPTKEQEVWLDNTIICIIPMYNVGGATNRGCCSRVNQNGPEMHGFRGNAKNLDLNRDFIKADSRNVRAFYKAYQKWRPDIFIDTHASNGADYQHTMTLIATQRSKLAPHMREFMDDKMLPALYGDMKAAGYPMSPYVHQIGKTPDEKGIMDYLETPRYSTGYSTLFHAYGFVTETHMWKPYKDRVLSTYEFLNATMGFASENVTELKISRNQAMEYYSNAKKIDLAWELDTTVYDEIEFMGYEARYKKSDVTGLDRLYYDRKKPYTKTIPYYNTYKATVSAETPKAYIIPRAYQEVIKLLELNGVGVSYLSEDIEMEFDMYRIVDHQTGNRPYESHYLHRNTEVVSEKETVKFRAGDAVVYTGQFTTRFITEVLEPQGVDSYFSWNYFDGILQQKEWFSSYIFEDLAAEILAERPDLQEGLAEMQKDPEVAKNQFAQLYYIYKNSQYYEPNAFRYPVGRLMKVTKLPLR